jgi:hypothetical protein
MYDPDEFAYYESLNQEIDRAEQTCFDLNEKFRNLVHDRTFQLLKTLLFEKYIYQIPSVSNAEAGLYEAFASLKFRQGIRFVFDFVESVSEYKDQNLENNSDEFI